jgi:WD40 repeat protein
MLAVGGLVLLKCLATAAPAAPTVLHATHVIQCDGATDGRPTVVTGVAITPDGRTIAAATDDHQVLLWDAASAALKARLGGHGDWVRSVSVSPDAAMFATGASDHMVCLWDIQRQVQLLQLPVCPSAVSAVCFHPNSQQVAVVGFCKTLQIINTSSGQVTQELDCPCEDMETVAFSADGARMAVTGRNGQIRVWNVNNGALERDVATDNRRIRGLAFSPDGKLLAAAGNSPKIHVFDVNNGQLVMMLEARPAKAYALLFIDNQRLVVGGTDNLIRIWDVQSQVVTKELAGHTGTVAALAVDAAGMTLVSGSYDTTVRIWNLAEQTAPATASRGFPEAVR